LDISTAIQTYPFIALCGLGAWVSRYTVLNRVAHAHSQLSKFKHACIYIPIWSPQIGCHLLNNACHGFNLQHLLVFVGLVLVWRSESACACVKVWLCQTTLVWQVTRSHAHSHWSYRCTSNKLCLTHHCMLSCSLVIFNLRQQ